LANTAGEIPLRINVDEQHTLVGERETMRPG